ncbi:MAG: histidine phosphatase family protein [Acidobacteriota bacterium]
MNEISSTNRLRLYLIRHGEIQREAESACYGQTDVALSPIGKEQSHRLSEVLVQIPLVAVYSSDLARTMFAANLIAQTHNLSVESMQQLREINMGEWEGKSLSQINTTDPEKLTRLFNNPREFCYPGGESFLEFEDRIDRALKMILAAHRYGSVAVVTHGGVSRLILASILEMLPKNWLRLAQDFGCLNIIDWYDSAPIIQRLNQTFLR